MKLRRHSHLLRGHRPFSILERIDVGETRTHNYAGAGTWSFSILERIDVGETLGGVAVGGAGLGFQYPRTDRRG